MIKKIGGAMLHTCEYCGSSSYHVEEDKKGRYIVLTIGLVILIIEMIYTDLYFINNEEPALLFIPTLMHNCLVGIIISLFGVLIARASSTSKLQVTCLECGDIFWVTKDRPAQIRYLNARSNYIQQRAKVYNTNSMNSNEDRSSEENVQVAQK